MITAKVRSRDGVKVVKLTRTKAVRERCLNCSAWSAYAVSQCPFTDCPLYPFRTGKGVRGRSAEKNRAIVRYCQWCSNSRTPKDCTAKLCPLYVYRTGHIDNSVVLEEVKSSRKFALGRN